MNEAPPPYQALDETKTQTQGYQANNTVILQPTCTVVQQFREVPVRIKCPYCGNDVMTSVDYVSGTLAWITCLILCFVCPLIFFIPFCIEACLDAVHTCPNCHNIVGKYNRL